MRLTRFLFIVILSTSLSFAACTPKPPADQTREALIAKESSALNTWFDARFDDQLARSPMTQTYFGVSGAQSRLDDVSMLGRAEDAALQRAWLEEMRSQFDLDRLDPQSLLSYRLYEISAEDTLASYDVSDIEYVFDHLSGAHTSLPSFMMNFHSVSSRGDALAYISRLNGFNAYLEQHAIRAEEQAKNGVLLPQFIYPILIEASRNVIKGTPFSPNGDSPLWTDFTTKIDALELPEAEKTELKALAKQSLLKSVKPAYQKLIAMFQRHEDKANNDAGVWKLPDGKTYYENRLKHYTTIDMSADDIHNLGLSEVARIQDEMREIMKRVGFEGSLQDFFKSLRTDPKFSYTNDDEGRETYIGEATAVIDEMKARLDELFITKPTADLVVKRVEPFRENTAAGAFYNQPTLDGSRPGTYYINLRDMKELPIYQLQALAYHEGIPGHHMQIAIGMELDNLPKFRTLGGYTAYIEGWALYAETLPKELDLYTDPYQEFGQLSMEIFRAARLVLDTGLHHKKWTREQAVDYMLKNTANSEGDIRAEIDRYIVWPGQATAYKIGMLKIQSLSRDAEHRLGDKFDIREFHDIILANGAVPLIILEELIEDWIESKR